MKRFLTTLALAVGLASPAGAANLPFPAKAPAAVAPLGCTISYCVGWIVGADVTGVASSIDVLGQGVGGSFNGGGTLLGIHGGFRAWNGTFYLGGEIGVTYDVSGGASGVAPGFSDRFAAMEVAKIGGPIGALVGNTQGVTFPAALQPYLMSLYFNVGGKQRMGSTGVVGGAGAEFVITPRATINLDYFHVKYGNGGASDNPLVTLKDEDLIRLAFNWNFPVN